MASKKKPRGSDPHSMTLSEAKKRFKIIQERYASDHRLIGFWKAIIRLITVNGFVTLKQMRTLQIFYKILKHTAPKDYV